jgi:4-amino-4-deoxy-L-arabinose transferase-like glycosyltransferase
MPPRLLAALSRPRALSVLALGAVLMSFFFLLGYAPLFDVDEGAFSEATLEMFQRGDFLSTYLNGQPRYDKPILVYWLQAASVVVFGVNEFAFRFPSAVCATLWVLLTFLFVRRCFGLQRALLAAVVMATSLGVYIIGRAATADALLNCLIAASMFAAWLHLETGKRSWRYATFAAIGLGFLAKGPVALLIPLVVTLLFCWLRRDLKTWARVVFDWRGLLLFLAIAAPWYAAILYKEGWAFVDGFFFKHNVSRFSGPLQGHAGSLAYYIPVVVLATLPFTALLGPVLRRWKTVWRDDLQFYLLIWFAFVFVFFSVSGTKLPHYALYGMTGLFVLMAVYADELRSAFWAFLPALLFFATLVVLPGALALLLPHIADAYFREALSNADGYFGVGYFVFCALAGLLALYAMLERRIELAPKLAGIGVVTALTLSVFVVPAGAGLQQDPVREAALLCRERGIAPIMWRFNAPSFSVYRGQPTPTRDPVPGDVVITKAKRLAELPGYGYELLYSKNGVVLVRIKA